MIILSKKNGLRLAQCSLYQENYCSNFKTKLKKLTTVATSKENWKSFSFRESIGADFLGLLSKKNDFG